VQELRGEEEGPLGGPRPELHHVAQADAGLAHRAPPPPPPPAPRAPTPSFGHVEGVVGVRPAARRIDVAKIGEKRAGEGRGAAERKMMIGEEMGGVPRAKG
jgi:hypothetical protein